MSHFSLSQSAGLTGNDQYTKLLLHFDGVNGSTSMLDSNINTARTWTNPNNIPLSTSQSKFGGSSLFINNNTYKIQTSSPSPASDISYGGNNFAIDFWFYPTTRNSSCFISCHGLYSASYQFPIAIWQNSSGFPVYQLNYVSGPGPSRTGSTACTLNAWNHIAITKSGTVMRIFLNGVQGDSWDTSSNVIRTPSGGDDVYYVGNNSASSGTANTFYLDEYRHSVGLVS